MYYFTYIALPILIGILGILNTIIASKGALYDRRNKGFKYLKKRGWWVVLLSFLTVGAIITQSILLRRESNSDDEKLLNLQKLYADSVQIKVAASTKTITDNLAVSFKEQGLVYESGKIQILSDAAKIQFTTDVINKNLDKTKTIIDAIQNISESILNPITPMDVVIEYSLKIPNNIFSTFYSYIEKPSLNKPTRFSEFKLDSLSREEQSYINGFDYVNLSKYSTSSNKPSGDNGWITIEQLNLKEVTFSGTAKALDSHIIINVWKTMKNVFIRNKDFSGIQNYKSLLNWYISTTPTLPPNVKLESVLLLKILTGNPISQKIMLDTLPYIKVNENFGLFEKKISNKDFKREYQGP